MSKNIVFNSAALHGKSGLYPVRAIFTRVFKYSLIFSLAISANIVAAFAQQQQWASQYVSWTFNKTVDVWNIDQQVWIPIVNQTKHQDKSYEIK